jgi:hypothetical protein
MVGESARLSPPTQSRPFSALCCYSFRHHLGDKKMINVVKNLVVSCLVAAVILVVLSNIVSGTY